MNASVKVEINALIDAKIDELESIKTEINAATKITKITIKIAIAFFLIKNHLSMLLCKIYINLSDKIKRKKRKKLSVDFGAFIGFGNYLDMVCLPYL